MVKYLVKNVGGRDIIVDEKLLKPGEEIDTETKIEESPGVMVTEVKKGKKSKNKKESE